MYAIGVGDESEGELQLIASKPLSKHVFRVNDNAGLKRVKRMLQERSCTGNYTSRGPLCSPKVL